MDVVRDEAQGRRAVVGTILIGAAAGIGSGLLGVGGGIIMIPPLTAFLGFTQHRAHATSLAAIVILAAFGAGRFALADSVNYSIGALLAVGAIVGAPVGARIMARVNEAQLKTMFGVLMIVVAIQLLWP
jgi:uncharacterized membrane protein YfcA